MSFRPARMMNVGCVLWVVTALNPLVFAENPAPDALPTGGRVVAGNGSISQSGPNMTIQQNTERMIVNWQSFDIGTDASITFIQPNATSMALNRVIGQNPSTLLGRLQSNGKVLLINPAGVLFGQNSQVNVGGITASTLAIRDNDFLSGDYHFNNQLATGQVVNLGHILANGGVVALLSSKVINDGTIATPGGSTVLAAGDQVTLDFQGDGLVSVTVDQSRIDALVANGGLIRADQGLVVLTAGAARDLLSGAVNNTGIVEATGLSTQGGRILLEGAEVTHAGRFDVSSATSNGGSVQIAATDITLASGSSIDATGATGGGTVHVGGQWQGSGDMPQAQTVTMQADSVIDVSATKSGNGGEIVLWSDTGNSHSRTQVAGTLRATSGGAGGDGGRIETSGHTLDIADSTLVATFAPQGNAGLWLLDPHNFYISAFGGSISGITLSNNLANGDVTLLSSSGPGLSTLEGNIYVNDNVSWSANRLTLTAANNVLVNAIMTATGSAKLTINTATANGGDAAVTGGQLKCAIDSVNNAFTGRIDFYDSGTGTPLTINGADYRIITTLGSAGSTDAVSLQGMNGGLSNNYALGANINAAATSTWNSGAGFLPIGSSSPYFTGSFDGLGHTISGLTINRPSYTYTGLLGYAKSPALRNVGLLGGSITGGTDVGSFVGAAVPPVSYIVNCWTTSSVTGVGFVGGLIGDISIGSLYHAYITDCYAAGNVNITGNVAGGLVGTTGIVTIRDCFATGNVSAPNGDNIGGLVGVAYADFHNVYATGKVTGKAKTGGLIGWAGGNSNPVTMDFTDSYATGNVTGTQYVGGLIGLHEGREGTPSVMTNCYALGTVTGSSADGTGGLIGRTQYGAVTFTNCYAEGTVTAGNNGAVGGLVGYVDMSMDTAATKDGDYMFIGCYATGDVSGAYSVGGLIGAVYGNTNFYNLSAADTHDYARQLTLEDCYATGNVSGVSSNPGVGGLVGKMAVGMATRDPSGYVGTVSYEYDVHGCYATGSVSSTGTLVGGLIGFLGLDFTASEATFPIQGLINVTDCYAEGTVTSTASTTSGGLIGQLTSGTENNSQGQINITDCHASGDVTAQSYAGGLIASIAANYLHNQITLKQVYATGNVKTLDTSTNDACAGGLIGYMAAPSGSVATAITIHDAYARGSVTAGSHTAVGGLIGYLYDGSLCVVSNVYATGLVNAGNTGTNVGGLLGKRNGITTFTNSFWDTQTTGQATSIVGVGKTTAQMLDNNTFLNAGWNFTPGTNVWAQRSYLNDGYPYLGSIPPLIPLQITLGNLSRIYGNANPNLTGLWSVTLGDPSLLTGLTWNSTLGTNTDVGTYNYDYSYFDFTFSLGMLSEYAITFSNNHLAVTPRPIDVTGTLAASNKVYDGTRNALLNMTGLTLDPSGILNNDVISLSSGTGLFDNKNAGTGKTVTAATFTLTGPDAANYTAVAGSGLTTATADITPKSLALTGTFTADGKVYDATTAAVIHTSGLSINSASVIAGDTVSLNTSNLLGHFVDKNVGVGKAVYLGDASLTGADAANYTLTGGTSATATITVAPLTINLAVDDKVYDRTTAATWSSATLSGVKGSDAVALNESGATAAFTSKDAGTNKNVLASGFALSGADINNYSLSQPTGLKANITPYTLTVDVAGVDRVYNQATTATLSITNDHIAGDDVIFAYGASFADKNAGVDKTVSYTLGLAGMDSGNYQLASTTGTVLATITPKSLDLSGVTASNKVYDATADATLNTAGISFSGKITGDDLSIDADAIAGHFADKNVGTGKAVTLDGVVLSGNDAGNYTIAHISDGFTATITAAPLTITGIAAADKVYDRSTAATWTGATLSGVIGSDDIALDESGATAAFSNKDVGTDKNVLTSGFALSGDDAINYTLTQPTGLKADITPYILTVEVAGVDRVYDQTTSATLSITDDHITGDDVMFAYGASFADKNAGVDKTVSYTLGMMGMDSGNYQLASTTGTVLATITPKSLDVSGVAASNKVYDGTTDATLNTTSVNFTGIISGDDLSVDAGAISGRFADKHVGNAKAITLQGVTLTGDDAANYTLANVGGVTADITPAPITISTTDVNRVYNADTDAAGTATVTGGTLFGTDAISGGDFAFTSKNVGANKTVNVSNVTIDDGNDGGNYAVTYIANTTSTITAAQLTVAGISADDKVYDATPTATWTGAMLSGVQGLDSVSIDESGASAAFNNKNVGQNKTVTASGFGLSGADAGNYQLVQPTGLTADITPAELTVTGVTVSNKVYDQTTAATWTGATVSGKLGSDVIVLDQTGATANFADKNVGNNKAVTASGFTVTGADSGNYTLVQPTGLTADITPYTLTVNYTGVNKVYDRTTDASVTTSDDRFTGDALVVNRTAAFTDKNVGDGKLVNVTGVSLNGADANNYQMASTTGAAHADITPKSLAVNLTGSTSKVYDGTTVIGMDGITASLVGVILGDTVNPDAASVIGSVDRNAGDSKTATYDGFALQGADAGNYVLASTSASGIADVTPRTLNVSYTGIDKVYDRTTDATATTSDDRVLGDELSILFTAAFDNWNVGQNKAVNISGASLSGDDAGNYLLAATGSATADITPRQINLQGLVAADKTYDGNTHATISNFGSLTGVIAGDSVAFDAEGNAAQFASANVGTSIPVTVTGITLTGEDSGNYHLTTPMTAADITSAQKPPTPPSSNPTPGGGSSGTGSSGGSGGSGSGGGGPFTPPDPFGGGNSGGSSGSGGSGSGGSGGGGSGTPGGGTGGGTTGGGSNNGGTTGGGTTAGGGSSNGGTTGGGTTTGGGSNNGGTTGGNTVGNGTTEGGSNNGGTPGGNTTGGETTTGGGANEGGNTTGGGATEGGANGQTANEGNGNDENANGREDAANDGAQTTANQTGNAGGAGAHGDGQLVAAGEFRNADGTTSGMSFSITAEGGTKTLTVAGIQAGNQKVQSTLSVFLQSQGSLQYSGKFTVTREGSSWTITEAETDNPVPPVVNEAGMRTASMQVGTGGQAGDNLTVKVSPDGTMIIQTSAAFRNTYDRQSIILLAMTVVYQQYQLEPDAIHAIVFDDIP